MKLKMTVLTFVMSVIFFNVAFAEDEPEVLSVDLEKSIYYALKNNPEIEQSRQGRESARWQLSQVRRQSGLNVNYTFTGERGKNSAQATEDEERSGLPLKNTFTHEFRIVFPLYRGGQLKNLRRQREFALNEADLTLEDTKQSIRLQAANAYYDVLRAKYAIYIYEEEIKTLQEHLRRSTIQYNEGVVARSDILATSVALANSKQRLTSAQAEYKKTLATLNKIMGFPAENPLIVDEELSYTENDLILTDCLEYAEQNRPDYFSSLYAVEQAKYAVEEAKAQTRPAVDAVAKKNTEGDRFFKSNNQRSWGIGIDVTWNIFDNGVTAATVKDLQAKMKAAESVAKNKYEALRLEVYDAYTDLKAAEENIKVSAGAASEAKEEYELCQLRYVEGVGTNLDVMYAQEKLSEARSNYSDALYNYNVAIYTLEKSMGIPVDTDVPDYVAAQRAGKNSDAALQESAVGSEPE